MPPKPDRPVLAPAEPPPAGGASATAPARDGGAPPPEAGPEPPAGPGVNSPPDGASNREARKKEAAEDRVLIEAAQRGDRGAFRTLVERHQRRAFSIAHGLVRDENDAREVVQEAFLRVYKGLATFEHGSSF